ncbi:hypothetical protein GCM10018952_46250 [Streptosporangium vulgare]
MTVPAATQRKVAEADADVIVVGAGPAGSTTAFHLAQAGLDVLLLEKTTFPREKVCGDGLTPRAVKQLIAMGIDIDAPGWVRNKGLRVVGGGMRFELDWPELSSFPDFGLVRTRQDFDEILAANAVKAGVRLLQGVNVTAPVLDDRSGHIVGVTAKRDGEEVTYRSRLVVAADGNSTRISLAMGLHKREDRPMGVAVRTYFESPRHDDDYLETWLELWDGDTLLPGYGWIFGVGDGTSNVGLGLLNTSESFKGMDYRDLLKRWVKGMPPEWGYVEENMTTPIRGGRAADGLQPPAALHAGPGAGGRRRWDDQPVQRRGHRVRDGDRPHRRRDDRPGARQGHPRAAGARTARLPSDVERRIRWLLHPRQGIRGADRAPRCDELRDASRAATPPPDAVRPQAPC